MSCNWTASIKLHCLATFPAPTYVTKTPVIFHCKTIQVHNCHIISTTGLFVELSCWDTLVQCLPGHCDCVPTARILGQCTWGATNNTDRSQTQVTSVFTKYGPVVGKEHCAPQTLVMPWTCVTFIGSRWEKRASVQCLYSCTVPTMCQIHQSSQCGWTEFGTVTTEQTVPKHSCLSKNYNSNRDWSNTNLLLAGRIYVPWRKENTWKTQTKTTG